MMNEKQDPPLSYLQVIPGRCKDTQTKSEREIKKGTAYWYQEKYSKKK